MLEAGRIQLASFGKDGLRIDKKGAIDLVTEVDVAVERRFRAFIAERFPDHAILAEEMGGPAPGSTARHCWIYDPIDGTTNFAHGLPIFCASLALEIDGVISGRRRLRPDPRGALHRRAGRRRLPERPPAPGDATRTPLIDALLCTGFHYDVHRSGEAVLGLFGAFVRRARAVRRLGSAALDLAYVAAGRFDGFWEDPLKPWDIAAGGADRAGSGRCRQRHRRRAVRRPEGPIRRREPHAASSTARGHPPAARRALSCGRRPS